MTRFALLSGLGHAVFVAVGLLIYVMGTRIGRQRRHPSAAVAWVLAIVAFPYAAVPLFLMFGSRKFVRPVRRTVSVLAAEPPDAVAAPLPVPGPAWATRLLAGLELAPPVRNARIGFHGQGPQALEALLATMASARHSLDVCTFVFGDDAVGERVAQALRHAAARGVAVRLLLDAVGSLGMPAGLRRALKDGGVQVRRFMPLLHNPMRGHTNLRNHRKLVVADGERLWSGGRNLACEYFMDRPRLPAWVDLSYEIDGPLALQAAAQFAADWQAASGRMARAVLPRPLPAGPADGAPAQWVPSGPDHADDTVHSLLLAGAFHAQESIVAVTPYFVPDDALLDAWCLACRRGVRVRLLVPARSNHRLADWARARALRELSQAGAEVWLAPGMVHAKAVVIDADLALSGSLNLDARSLFLNYEAMTAFYGPAEVQWLAGWCDAQIARAQRFHARRPSWARDIAEGVVRAVGFQL
ncbi:phospholipase D-like domain-containing protein [Acidovorax sp. GBBC 3334]|uniref:phospholipase D-like domain-containing protein n=1 Tax=Acidovorax sp. GBBC 3334 TaxID=2940496 RepID=UPI0023034CBC|nr:phospholipase D-like domain-containing protein [Acidovorax sp. GBBC 3334]MDA8453651.1 phospholipase D-like domain-containing protein [Acidovorax sp. GBBC 3334]